MKKSKNKYYSKAAFSFGVEKGFFDQWVADLESVADKLNAELELKRFLLDKHATLTEKKKALIAVFQDFISDKTYNFILLLIKDKKLRYLDDLIEQIKKEHLAHQEIFEVVVESVLPLSLAQEKKLQELIFDKLKIKVMVKGLINKELIGGLKVALGDQVIDASLRGKIQQLREKINSLE